MNMHSGDVLVEACLEELMANCTDARCSSQSFCRLFTKLRRICSTVRLALSVKPSVCGWYAVDIGSVVPMMRHSVCQNSAVKRGSRSEMMEVGIPKCTKMFS